MTNFTRKSKTDYTYRSGELGPVIELSVSYSAGFSLSSRGVWFALRPVTISTDSYSLSLMAGVRLMLAPLERAKPAVLLAMAERIDPIAREIVAAWGPEASEKGDEVAVAALIRSAFGMEVVG